MGQEITETRFSEDDFARFGRRLAYETQRARQAWADGEFAEAGCVAGFELEAWLIDRNFYPVACNQAFLARLADPLVVPELSRFNIELNGTPQPLARPRAVAAGGRARRHLAALPAHRARGRSHGHRHRHPADAARVRPDARQHVAAQALRRAQPAGARSPRRPPAVARHRRQRPAAHHPRRRDAGGGDDLLPGASAGTGERGGALPQRLDGAVGAAGRAGRQLAFRVRAHAVARDAHPAVRAGGRLRRRGDDTPSGAASPSAPATSAPTRRSASPRT